MKIRAKDIIDKLGTSMELVPSITEAYDLVYSSWRTLLHQKGERNPTVIQMKRTVHDLEDLLDTLEGIKR